MCFNHTFVHKMKKKKKIIYIIGLGRSGTTLLDIILGNSKNNFSCGELNRYPYEEGRPYQYPEDYPQYSFWMDLKEKFEKKHSVAEYKNVSGLYRQFEYHVGFFLNYFNLISKKKFIKYLSFVEDVYDNIFENISQSVLIDSSKYSSRAISLSRSEKYEVVYIYIKRNPVNVINSFAKTDVEQNSKSWFQANVYYFIGSMLCELAFRKLNRTHKCVKINFEDLVNRPALTLTKVATHTEIDLSESIKIVENKLPLNVGMIYYGNRVRLKKNIILKEENSGSFFQFKHRITSLLNNHWYRYA